MNRNRWLRLGHTPAVGAPVAAGVVATGVVGAALLVGPLASSQALFPAGITYYNGGFCYQNPTGEENPYRLRFFESSYERDFTGATLTFMLQKWDGSSNQYQDERRAFMASADKAGLSTSGQGRNSDPSHLCTQFTESVADRYLGGDVYRYGEYTSTRTVEPEPEPQPEPTPTP